MRPNDPRHGTYAGAQAHKADNETMCEPCATARYRYTKAMKLRQARHGSNHVPLGEEAHNMLKTYPIRLIGELSGITDPRLYTYLTTGPTQTVNVTTRAAILTIPRDKLWTATGVRRRIRALTALGWSAERIADACGVSTSGIITLRLDGDLLFVRRPTAAKVLEGYKALSMRLPDCDSPQSRAAATRSRGLAKRNGWPPPMAWENIDDPDEQPTGWEYRAPSRLDQVRDLIDKGAGLAEILRELRIGRGAFEKWCQRNGFNAEYSALVEAERMPTVYRNQHTKEAS